MKRIFFLFIISLILIPVVVAEQGHMRLLAVRETPTGYEGGTADLFLEIKPGSGRVFLEITELVS